MTTPTTTVAGLAVGDAVALPASRKVAGTGVVEAVGDCGYGRCPWGDECVTVRPDGYFTTLNFPADRLGRVS